MSVANTIIQLKKSGVTGHVPSSLNVGEVAINYADGKIFYLNSSNVVSYISTGTTTDSFATINAAGSLILATSNTDTLTIVGSNGITIQADTVAKKITINGSYDTTLAQNAYDEANIAFNVANAAYAYANTISSSSSNNWTLYNFPLGDRGLITQSLYGGLGGELIGEVYDMRNQPSIGPVILLDAGYLS